MTEKPDYSAKREVAKKEIDQSFGIIMVKPHAYDEASEVLISHLLGGDEQPISPNLISALNLTDKTYLNLLFLKIIHGSQGYHF